MSLDTEGLYVPAPIEPVIIQLVTQGCPIDNIDNQKVIWEHQIANSEQNAEMPDEPWVSIGFVGSRNMGPSGEKYVSGNDFQITSSVRTTLSFKYYGPGGMAKLRNFVLQIRRNDSLRILKQSVGLSIPQSKPEEPSPLNEIINVTTDLIANVDVEFNYIVTTDLTHDTANCFGLEYQGKIYNLP